jgi:ferritin
MKKLIVLISTIFICGALWAQQPRNDRIAAQRIAFITQRLHLSPEESQQFWPIYNQYTDKIQQIRNSAKLEKTLDEMNDAETEKFLMNQIDKEQRELDLLKEYYQKLRKVISVKKLAYLYRAEQDFKGELLNRLKEMRDERKQMRKGNN